MSSDPSDVEFFTYFPRRRWRMREARQDENIFAGFDRKTGVIVRREDWRHHLLAYFTYEGPLPMEAEEEYVKRVATVATSPNLVAVFNSDGSVFYKGGVVTPASPPPPPPEESPTE